MTNLQSKESKESNPWNPFLPTPRDIERTEQLAKKNSLITGILTFFFLPAAMIYLNRGLNPLKILGYAFFIAMTFAVLSSESEEEAFQTGQGVGTIANIVIVVENINTINQARKRQKNSEV